MSLLLDTHVLIWWLLGDSILSQEARTAVANEPQVFVSAATAWEIAIKQNAGRLVAPDDLEEQMERNGFQPLPIGLSHALRAGTLPRHHDDPFDRMLVAQAAAEGLTIVTRDPRIGLYGVPVIRA